MNGQDLYEGLRYVDPAMLEEAMEPVKRPKRRQYLPLAACLCLLLAGTAVAVFGHVEIRLLDVEHLEDYREADPSMEFVKNGSADEAYQAAGGVEITSLASLSEQAREDAAAGTYFREFDTWDAAAAYLGVEVPGTEGPTSVAFNMENGEIAEIRLNTHYQYEEWNASISVSAHLYTEEYSGEPGEFVLFHGAFEEPRTEEITLSGGETAQIAASFADNGFGMIAGYLARGQAFYEVSALCPEGSARQVSKQLETYLNELA